MSYYYRITAKDVVLGTAIGVGIIGSAALIAKAIHSGYSETAKSAVALANEIAKSNMNDDRLKAVSDIGAAALKTEIDFLNEYRGL